MAERTNSERGQAIILFVGIFSVILVMAAIVVDFGLWFAERRSAQRGADLAAAAGAQDLPLSPALAFESACAWAAANGYPNDQVHVEVFARDGSGSEEGCDSLPEEPPTPVCESQCDTVRVTVSKGAPRLFTGLFGLGDFEIGAVAAAGLTFGGSGGVGGTGADQTVLLVDAQSRMRNACNEDQSNLDTCAIANERVAAAALVDSLLGLAGNGQIGYAPYHNCYGPETAIGTPVGCVVDQGTEDVVAVVGLTSDSSALRAAIDATVAYTQKPANVCLPLDRANEMFLSAPSGGHKVIVLFSDGSNRYQHKTSHSLHPPVACHTTAVDPLPPRPPCTGSRSAESELDYRTLQMATHLKDDLGVEIYVIGLNPCPWAAATDLPANNSWQPADCGLVVPGHTTEDNVADQRLLMCIATSLEHYQRVNNVAELPNVIEEIAAEIVSRSLLQ
ncbi:MAG: VWA domain-containing protein [Chloroflexi bacterium]|nr:VWA domain-containing protein [Chloroflexota bacterium]